MKDALKMHECNDANPDNCTDGTLMSWIAPLYFIVFVMLAQFTLVNVVVAVLMRHLEESNESDDGWSVDGEDIYLT